MEKESHLFNLSKEIDFHNNGQLEKSAQVEMLAPTFKNYESTMKLSQFLLKSMRDNEKTINNEQITEEDIAKMNKEKENFFKDDNIVFDLVKKSIMSSNVNSMSLLDEFLKICNTSCFIDNKRKVSVTRMMLEKLTPFEVMDMIVTYIAIFLARSVL